MNKYALAPLANIANWVLIALLTVAVFGSLALVLSGASYALLMLLFSVVLLVGAILRRPLIYLTIALLSLLALAANLKSAHFALSAINISMLALSVYIRGNVFVRVPEK
jgi:hypothetical protein